MSSCDSSGQRRRVQTHSEPDHVMFLPDNGVALRFENDSNFPQEWAVLEFIRPQLGEIPIPDYTYMPKSAKDFAGYKTIPEARLSRWRFQRLSKASRSSESRRLGRFLTAQHKTPLEPVGKLGVRNRDRSP